MSGTRSLMRPRGEHPEYIFAPFGNDLNITGRYIFDPTLQAKVLSLVPG